MGDALHPVGADRLDARLFHRLEDGLGFLRLRHETAMDVGVVTGEPQRHGIGIAAQDGGFARGELARRLGQPRLGAFPGADERGPIGREGHFQIARLGHGAHAADHRPA